MTITTSTGTDSLVRQPRERAVPCCICGRDTWEIDGICRACQDSRERFLATDTPSITEQEIHGLIDAMDDADETALLRGLADSFPSPALTRAVLAAVESDRSRDGWRAGKLLGLLSVAMDQVLTVRMFTLGDYHQWCCDEDATGCGCLSSTPAGSPDVIEPCEACDLRVHTVERDAVTAVLTYLRDLL